LVLHPLNSGSRQRWRFGHLGFSARIDCSAHPMMGSNSSFQRQLQGNRRPQSASPRPPGIVVPLPPTLPSAPSMTSLTRPARPPTPRPVETPPAQLPRKSTNIPTQKGKNDDNAEQTCIVCLCEFTVEGDSGDSIRCSNSHFYCSECTGVLVTSIMADLDSCFPPKCGFCRAAIPEGIFERQLNPEQLAHYQMVVAQRTLGAHERMMKCGECPYFEIRTDQPVVWYLKPVFPAQSVPRAYQRLTYARSVRFRDFQHGKEHPNTLFVHAARVSVPALIPSASHRVQHLCPSTSKDLRNARTHSFFTFRWCLACSRGECQVCNKELPPLVQGTSMSYNSAEMRARDRSRFPVHRSVPLKP